jgi:hypothetical protein
LDRIQNSEAGTGSGQFFGIRPHEEYAHMERMKKTAALVLSAVFMLFFCACNIATGDEALQRMNPDEKQYLKKLISIKPDMDESKLAELLGPVYRGGGTARPVWLPPGGGHNSQVAVYLLNEKVFKVRWLKIGEGAFMWEKNFPEVFENK